MASSPYYMNDNYLEAYKKVSDLVDDFETGYNHYKNPSYSETRVREDFINKFFSALGWDVTHDFQKNPYKQEVKLELTQKQEGSKNKKFADYAFYLEPDFKNPVFFVEAKKPAVLLEDNTGYYLQTHKYGWNSQTPLSILTDFEEFIVIDCRTKPHPKFSVSTAVRKYNFRQYKDETIFRELYYLFSREAVADGSLIHFVETQIPKTKTKERQLKMFGGGYKSVDDDFLEYIDSLRLDLARGFYAKDNSLTPQQLTEATQKTIDRLVFVRFLEDKQIEFEEYINELKDWKEFVQLSKMFDGKYNGIVFKESFIDKPSFGGIDKGLFQDLCYDISSKESPYNFNSIPVHILGSIYERFLGKVVSIEGGKVDIIQKPEVRKAGGVFYTPKYIVDYIIDKSVGKLIKGKTPKEIDKLSFADISCGSGSFLIGVYEYLIDYHKNYYVDKLEGKTEIDGRSEDLGNAMFSEGVWVLTLKRKQEILLNCVYGVDIDNQAVEVSQLSLFLKLLEDESFGSTTKSGQVTAFSKVLPDLTQNIQSGNSLVGWDILNVDDYTIDEQKRINPFSYKESFLNVFKNGGFDAIVGNPPYLKERGNQEVFDPVNKTSLGVKYHVGKMDFWYYFVHRGYEILKTNGILAFITNSYWTKNDGAKLLRSHINTDFQVVEIVDYKSAKVFKDVSGKHNTFIFKKGRQKNYKAKIREIIDIQLPEIEQSYTTKDIPLNKLFDNNGKINYSLNKVEFKGCGSLDDYYDSSVGVQESVDKVSKKQYDNFGDTFPIGTGVFVLNKKEIDQLGLTKNENEIVKPYVNTNYVLKYGIREPQQYLIYSDKNIKKLIEDGEYPNVRNHLQKMKQYITSSNKPFGIHRPRNVKYFENHKILCKGMFAQPEFYLDKNKMYCGFSFSVVIQKNKKYSLEFLLGCLNSELGTYWFLTNGKKRGIGVDIGVKVFRQFPVPKLKAKDSQVKEIESLVESITETVKLKTNSLSSSDIDFYDRKIKNLENQLDKLIYDLYGIEPDDIAIIQKNLI